MSVRFNLTDIERKALTLYANKHGRTWKSSLLNAWETRFGLRGEPYEEALRRLQHTLGEPGLDRIEIDLRAPAKPARPEASRPTTRKAPMPRKGSRR